MKRIMTNIKIRYRMLLLFGLILAAICVIGRSAVVIMDLEKESAIEILEEEVRDSFDNQLKVQVESACSMLQGIYDGYVEGQYSLTEAKKMGADLLRGMTYGDNDYFWADTYEGVNVVLYGSDTEGTMRYNNLDATGYAYVKEFISVGRSGGGYVDFTVTRVGGTEAIDKRGYCIAFEPFEWVVGTGNFADTMDEYVATKSAILEAEMTNYAMRLSTIIFISLIVVFVVGLSITVGILRPIRLLKEVTEQLANGNLDADIDSSKRDEVGDVARNVHKLIGRLKDYIVYIDEITDLLHEMGSGNLNITFRNSFDGDFKKVKDKMEATTELLNEAMGRINQVADQVAVGSIQVSDGAQALSQGATEQASAVEELAATVEQINHSMKSAEEAADQASARANEAGTMTSQCNDYMRELVAAMNDISNTSEKIEKIIKEIDDISFQTNILALNAAVEAARAGTAGKGFAVVADEVRNLANKSAEAAKNTAALIADSRTAVEKGASLVDTTAGRLQEVTDNANEMAAMIQNIALTAKNSSDSIGQVSVGLDQIASVVQNNSATAEESAAASQELSSQADRLKDLVGEFQLADC